MIKILLLLLFWMFIIQTFSQYDESIAYTSLYLSQFTYCNTFDDCESCIIDYIVENHGSLAIQGFENQTNTIFTVFRGSSNIHNWLENIQISHISPYSENSSILVEKGFYTNYGFLRKQLFNNLQDLSKNYNTNKLLISGHSLGSCAATLFAYELATYYSQQYSIAHFYTFGSPRVGNDVFVYDFDQKVTGYRVVHDNDIVTSVPPIIMNYAHISNCIRYNKENTNYTDCDDDSCSISECSTDDHIHYLNITMGQNGC